MLIGYSKPERQFYDNPAAYDDTYLSNTHSIKSVDADAAFRKSLFDAISDDNFGKRFMTSGLIFTHAQGLKG